MVSYLNVTGDKLQVTGSCVLTAILFLSPRINRTERQSNSQQFSGFRTRIHLQFAFSSHLSRFTYHLRVSYVEGGSISCLYPLSRLSK